MLRSRFDANDQDESIVLEVSPGRLHRRGQHFQRQARFLKVMSRRVAFAQLVQDFGIRRRALHLAGQRPDGVWWATSTRPPRNQSEIARTPAQGCTAAANRKWLPLLPAGWMAYGSLYWHCTPFFFFRLREYAGYRLEAASARLPVVPLKLLSRRSKHRGVLGRYWLVRCGALRIGWCRDEDDAMARFKHLQVPSPALHAPSVDVCGPRWGRRANYRHKVPAQGRSPTSSGQRRGSWR